MTEIEARPAVEEFMRLCTDTSRPWGIADSDVIDLCKHILHLESLLRNSDRRVQEAYEAAIELCDRYDDCSPAFIAEKLRERRSNPQGK